MAGEEVAKGKGQQLFFQNSPRLNEETTVNGFVRHAHALVIGIVHVQPSGNLLGRPVQDQFTRNAAQLPDRAASTVSREVARLDGRSAYRAHEADDQAWPMKSAERTVAAQGNPPNQRSKEFQDTADAVDAAGHRKSCPTRQDRAFRNGATELQPALPLPSRRAEPKTMNQTLARP